jgi:hypothetical protein
MRAALAAMVGAALVVAAVATGFGAGRSEIPAPAIIHLERSGGEGPSGGRPDSDATPTPSPSVEEVPPEVEEGEIEGYEDPAAQGPGDVDATPDADNSGPGSDNSGPGSDNSGPGSDNSGPGSDSSGSGSGGSGSGSSGSGSGGGDSSGPG